MNRIYRLVFNTSHGLVQVASEIGSTKGKGTGAQRTSTRPAPKKSRIALALALSLGAIVPLLSATPAEAVTSIPGTIGTAGGAGGAGSPTAPGAGASGTTTGTYANYGGDGGIPVRPAGYAGGPGGGGYGAGGRGGNYYYLAGYGAYDGGGGGAGGGPGAILGSGSFQVDSGPANGVYGGGGGAGGYGLAGGYSGYGGGGGAGVFGAGFTLTNNGHLGGGFGGASPWYGMGGPGGAGISGSGFTVYNNSGIYGGPGGNSSYYAGGPGGPGIVSTGNSSIINSNVLVAGYSGTGNVPSVRTNAVEFSGGGNQLVLMSSGGGVVGNAVSTSGTTGGGDTLELGGDTDFTLAGTFAGTAPTSWTGTAQFYGFQNLLKSGTSTWTVTTVTDATPNVIPNWRVDDGTLFVDTGNNFNPAASDSLTIGIKPTASTTTTPGIDNGLLSVGGTANLNSEALTVHLAKGKYLDGVSYTLVSAGTAVSGTFGSVTYSPSLPSKTTPSITYGANTVTLSFAGGFKIGGGGGAFDLLSLAGLIGVAAAGSGMRRRRREGT